MVDTMAQQQDTIAPSHSTKTFFGHIYMARIQHCTIMHIKVVLDDEIELTAPHTIGTGESQ